MTQPEREQGGQYAGNPVNTRTTASTTVKKFQRQHLRDAFHNVNWNPSGKVCDVVGTVIEASLPSASLGSIVNIAVRGKEDVLAEVVGFRDERALLLPYTNLSGISPGCSVFGEKHVDQVAVGDFLMGKIVDPFLKSLTTDSLTVPERCQYAPLEREAPNPMARKRIDSHFSLGVRAIDTLLTFGEGQRIGILAGSGVGKSVLLGMMARGSDADINVIGLIGERGREVREFLERDLGEEGLKKSVVVCSTGDQSPLMRIRAAKMVTSIAEHFSAKGKKVLLMMDSLTRVAMAQREIGLAVGEPPTTKGYPPSTFSLLPKLLERCGPQADGHGSISGIYTVLVDGDDFNDPIPDAARSILDGHIQLSRQLAAKGHFPAIDINTSASRVMRDVVNDEHWEMSMAIRELLGVYQENFDYVQIGSYQQGTNPKLDAAIALMPTIERFLKQGINELAQYDASMAKMRSLFQGSPQD